MNHVKGILTVAGFWLAIGLLVIFITLAPLVVVSAVVVAWVLAVSYFVYLITADPT